MTPVEKESPPEHDRMCMVIHSERAVAVASRQGKRMSETEESTFDPLMDRVPTWDGVTLGRTLTPEERARRHELIDFARAHRWGSTLAILAKNRELINVTRPDGYARYAVLHHAAYGGAPVDVVVGLLALGAWRTLRNSKGERPVDVARRRGHAHLLRLLEPVVLQGVALDTLQQIQQHFHELIRERAEVLVAEQALRLPELEVLRELPKPAMWFPVPGMYGGFEFLLETFRGQDLLVSSSWCRVAEGSGEEHLISRFGRVLIDSEFV
jgi:hypothetical protein